MPLKSLVRSLINKLGYDFFSLSRSDLYHQDGLTTIHNHDFIKDPLFMAAYARGIQASGVDHQMHWRVHVALWVARQIQHLPGAFVECGVSTGFLSSAIMSALNWNSMNKDFYLLDTFQGLDPRYMSDDEKTTKRLDWYHDLSYENIQKNFSEFKNVHLIKGTVPDTLHLVDISQVCYLSLDMNCTIPEIAAANFFWDKLVPGGMILLDDYAYSGYEEQNRAFNQFAQERGIDILSIPTGQGLILKH